MTGRRTRVVGMAMGAGEGGRRAAGQDAPGRAATEPAGEVSLRPSFPSPVTQAPCSWRGTSRQASMVPRLSIRLSARRDTSLHLRPAARAEHPYAELTGARGRRCATSFDLRRQSPAQVIAQKRNQEMRRCARFGIAVLPRCYPARFFVLGTGA